MAVDMADGRPEVVKMVPIEGKSIGHAGHAKDILQQYTQGKNKTRPEYNVTSVSGPAHKPNFEVEVVWEGKIIGKACGSSKKEAEQTGAYNACKQLGIIEE